MPFDARRWPNAVTIGWLIAERMGMGVHCNKCARHVVMDPATSHLAPETPVPSRVFAGDPPERERTATAGSRFWLSAAV